MITEDLTDFGVTGWMLLQAQLVENSFIGVRLAHAGKKLADDGSLGTLVKLFRDLVEKFGMLVHNLYDVVQVV